MDAYERQLLSRLENRLLRHPDEVKDVEAERAVARLVAARSDAAYLLLQRALVLEAALEQVRGQFERLREAQAAERPASPVPPDGGPPPAAGRVGAVPARSFLRDAAVISAGVVGGSLLVKGVEALFDTGDAAGATDVDTDGWL
jgi:hypothetical protein